MSVQGTKVMGAQQTQTTTAKPASHAGAVTVEIRGKRLSIRTDHDPEYVMQLARYMDNKVRSLQTMAPSAPFEKLLMLASLNVAEELFDSQESLMRMRRAVADRTESMMALLDAKDT